MARIYTIGLEGGDLLPFDVSDAVLSTATVRSGAYSLKCLNGKYGLKNVTALAEGYWRIPLRYVTLGTGEFFRWLSSTTQLGSIRINSSTRRLELYTSSNVLVATGTNSILANNWYLVEVYVKIHDTSGVITVRVNGVEEVTFSGDTKPGTATTIDNVVYFAPSTAEFYFDDLAMNDTTGGVDDSWCGDGHVIALLPDANGDLSQLVGSDGNSTDNYLLVDERPADDDTTYVQGSTVNEKDLYNLAACGLTDVTIHLVWAESRTRDTESVGGKVALTVKTHSTEYDGPDVTLGTAYQRAKGTVYTVNPNTSAAWTVAELDALQVGPKTRA